MDLSLIISCHNLEDYIGNLLESLLRQKTKYQVEYIFVLDDCTDNTRGVIEASGLQNYSIITCCVHANGIAKNIGLEQSRGDYIWFVDGDDWLLGTDAYDTILDAMKEDHAHRMQVQFATNGWRNQSEYTIWQHVFSREFLHGLRFSRMAHSSDVYFMAKAFEKEKSIQGLPPVRLTKQKYYYYYYGRPGAVTTQVRETGKVEP